MIRRPPRSTQSRSSAASDVYKRQLQETQGWGQQPQGQVISVGVQPVAVQYQEHVVVNYTMGPKAWCFVILLVLLCWPLCWIPCVCRECQDQEMVRVMTEAPHHPLLHNQHHHQPHSHC
eukprot:TRINITY_DN969_c0_g1_i4.p2 TRINITY_DN969_c0_g1~~TRINITY_DN969_c0_g1_i4.p2  ORF type:complete len:119 (+),score=48.41 TRINITY_DN969_c0_g1_i4:116-472(+)